MATEERYNKTQLSPDKEFERHIFHRDQFAHYLRWSHVLKCSKIDDRILDVGCGSGNLLELLYRNKHKCSIYYGLDIRKKTIEMNREKFKAVDWAQFLASDIVKESLPYLSKGWDIICCFEVLAHVGKNNADKVLFNIAEVTSEETLLLLSTPCYDERVGAANNHMIAGSVGEFTFQEMKMLLEKHFKIEKVFGTFASVRDYERSLSVGQMEVYFQLKEYYDSNMLSVIMAPMFPEKSRNCIWKLRKL